jgi:hypothetical protein
LPTPSPGASPPTTPPSSKNDSSPPSPTPKPPTPTPNDSSPSTNPSATPTSPPGLSEYILGSLPFFVKWFVKFDDTKGSKQSPSKISIAAKNGRFLGPFARILLAVAALREKKNPKPATGSMDSCETIRRTLF